MSRIMTAGIDYTSRDYESLKQDMIAMLQQKIPEYTDISETDAGIVLLECLAMGCDIVNFYLDVQANECFLLTCEQRQNALMWCRMFGYSPQSTTPSHVMVVFTLQSVATTNITIPKGTVVKTTPTAGQNSILFTTEDDLVITEGNFGNEKNEDGNYLFEVSAIHGIKINKEIVGISNGERNQSFSLSYYPIVIDSVVVEVYEDNNIWYEWKQVENFADSNYLSRHYRLIIEDNNQAFILFGDGNTGKIPPQNQNGIRVSYMNGGGVDANVAAETINLMHTSNAMVKSVINPKEVYIRGLDKESLSSIKVNAPSYLRTKWGALTVNDFSELTKLSFPEVLYSDAQKHPTEIDDIIVYILLRDGVKLSDKKKEEIFTFLDDRKIAGVQNIIIEEMEVYLLDLECVLVVEDDFVRGNVKKYVEDYLNDFFAVGALQVSEDISLTELEALIHNNIRGVHAFRITNPTDLILDIPDGQIAELKSLKVIATGGVEM